MSSFHNCVPSLEFCPRSDFIYHHYDQAKEKLLQLFKTAILETGSREHSSNAKQQKLTKVQGTHCMGSVRNKPGRDFHQSVGIFLNPKQSCSASPDRKHLTV